MSALHSQDNMVDCCIFDVVARRVQFGVVLVVGFGVALAVVGCPTIPGGFREPSASPTVFLRTRVRTVALG